MDIKIVIDEDLTKEVKKTRKDHDCVNCGKVIAKATPATALSYRTDKGKKLYKVYTHPECSNPKELDIIPN